MKNGLKFFLAFVIFFAILVGFFTPLWMLITTIALRATLPQWYFIINLIAAGFLVILEFVGIISLFDENKKKETNKNKHTDYEDFN